MSSRLKITDSWLGMEEIKHLVVFGDSFSSVGYSSKERTPTSEQPLGIDFPGLTSCERLDEATQEVCYEPNWVGHLVKTVNETRNTSPLLVYDYAISGDTISRMKLRQVKKEFLPHLAPRPEWAPWASTDTLFVTWIGINDCTWNIRLQPSSTHQSFDDLFKTQEDLYAAGARNFCVIDIPPVHIFPKGAKSPRAKAGYMSWNPLLRQHAEMFSSAHPDATVLLFSSWEVFTRILEHPRSSGAAEADELDRDALFVDGFHPSSALHAVIAKEFHQFLLGINPTHSSYTSASPP
ncbi:hypothetical protein C8Q80DRAFT_1243316 [Daedaleopsis nitida]|nr:hypothetical protein C8Q80DRAFT_1243316 [Daedaleopsis nitida]